MATAKKTKKPKVKLTPADNPSLCSIGDNIRLRVLEDFFIEKDLPKWKQFTKNWDKINEKVGISKGMSDKAIENKVNNTLPNGSEEAKAALTKEIKQLIAMRNQLEDDRWNIQDKHEKEVDKAIVKQAQFVSQLSMWDKLKNMLPFGKKVVPVSIAMSELMEHIELTSTEALAHQLGRLKAIEEGMRIAGQYNKADAVKEYRTILAEEIVVSEAGFTSFIPEEVMVDFVNKSERGTMVNFLRYYEDQIPAEVIDKKVAADKLMVFDNYVVAYYSDIIQKAATVKKKVTAAAEKKEREKRRDPILFGLIKNSRKLYYICDWVTDTDDLTLEKLEKELGIARSSLINNGSSYIQTTGGDNITIDSMNDTAADAYRRGFEQARQLSSTSSSVYSYNNDSTISTISRRLYDADEWIISPADGR